MLTKSACADEEYMQMRIARMKISAGPNAASAVAGLQEICSKLLAGK